MTKSFHLVISPLGIMQLPKPGIACQIAKLPSSASLSYACVC